MKLRTFAFTTYTQTAMLLHLTTLLFVCCGYADAKRQIPTASHVRTLSLRRESGSSRVQHGATANDHHTFDAAVDQEPVPEEVPQGPGQSNLSMYTQSPSEMRLDVERLRPTDETDVSSAASIPDASPSPAPAGFKRAGGLFRPNEGGPADVVEFDVMIMQVRDIDFKGERFTVDAVITLRWQDDRAKIVVNPGNEYSVFSRVEVRNRFWVPDMDIVNEDFGGMRETSCQYRVYADGSVIKVQRVLARVLASYDPSFFPFDQQNLTMQLASKKYMVSSLILVPAAKPSEVDPSVFGALAFRLVSSSLKEVTDTGELGLLQKSRGEFTMVAERRTRTYWSITLLPEMLLVASSYTVFIFPSVTAFIMPRVATSMISFLALMALSLKTSKLLPVRTGIVWIDVFEECCTFLVWSSTFFNIIVMVAIYEYKLEELAKKIEHEIRIIFPVISLIASALLLLGLWYLTVCAWLLRAVLVLALGGYLAISCIRVYRAKGEAK